ncbi:MAG: MBOAT family protein [Chthonomonas sp.]|nr:MBOAT family protein [Chthonomonas sp.]
MLFTAPEFAAFLLITFGLYYVPAFRRFQVQILVGASMVFYSWTQPILLLLLVTSVVLNSVISYRTYFAKDAGSQLRWAISGVVVNLAILGFFKYGNLIFHLVKSAFDSPGVSGVQHTLGIALPIGISFYTFEGISLLVDVIRSKQGDTKVLGTGRIVDDNFWQHMLNTSLFVTFFPHLIAGPILKARHYFPQIKQKLFGEIPWDVAYRTLVMGFFLKMVVADNISAYTNFIKFPEYQTLSTATGLSLLFGYSMQIFADFAGYSLIAIGLGHLFGYELPDNFNFPYISRSLSEFWRRWHISLSTWLRDYLYIPLGGNKKGNVRTYINLALVMVLGGLWHGAALSYAVWGAYHGLGLAIERLFTRNPDRQIGQVGSALKLLAVFTFVSFGWLLFKLTEFHQVVDFCQHMAANLKLKNDLQVIGPTLLFSIPVVVYHLYNLDSLRARRAELISQGNAGYRARRIAIYAVLLTAIILNDGTSNDFIYFQF